VKPPSWANAAESVAPRRLELYLELRGWKHVRTKDMSASLWRPKLRSTTEVLIPLNPAYRDYGPRLVEAIKRLAEALDKDEVLLLQELATLTSDTIRIRLAGEPGENTIRLESATKVLQATKTMLLLAGRRAAVLQDTAGRMANIYLRRVRMGQTESGSFTFTVLSELPVDNASYLASNLRGREEPIVFERTVVVTLSRMIGTALAASQEFTGRRDAEALRAATIEGLDAQFCSALAAIGSQAPQTSFDVAFAWSSLLDPPGDVLREARFSPEDVEAMTGLGQELRQLRASTPPREPAVVVERAPEAVGAQEVRVRGYVVGLFRPPVVGAGGVAVVAEDVRGVPRLFRLALEPAQYERAVEAHNDNGIIVFMGIVEGGGQELWVREVQDFAVVKTERST
jgi:hypothetical protein